jgi:hypothetical protein
MRGKHMDKIRQALLAIANKTGERFVDITSER